MHIYLMFFQVIQLKIRDHKNLADFHAINKKPSCLLNIEL